MEKYFEGLNENDKLVYRKERTLESGETLPDPYSLRNDWIKDADALPEVSWEDVTHYLIETPSIYTKGKLKAYKSLEAYDYFVCGHVQMCYYHPIKKNISFRVVKSQVLPSQRQSDSSNMYNVWVCILKKHGWILTANYNYCIIIIS